MKHAMPIFLLSGALMFGGGLGGCTQLPTEKQSIIDLRPQISFVAANEATHGARVLVDNLDMGAVGDFLEGKAAVRLLSGTHKVSVVAPSGVLLDEKVYLGEGVSRSFLIK